MLFEQALWKVFSSLILESDFGMSKRTFFDFYALAANGFEDVESVDVDHIVDNMWASVYNNIARIVYNRLILPSLGIISTKDDPDRYEKYERFTMFRSTCVLQLCLSPEDLAVYKAKFVHPQLRKFVTADDVEVMISAMRWYLTCELAKQEFYVDPIQVTSSNGMWKDLAANLVEAYRYKNAARVPKAMSVDKMLGWAHHHGDITAHLPKWVRLALDVRAAGNMNTLLLYTSPTIRDALKSATHGQGSVPITLADRIEMYLHRRGATNVKRSGNTFTVHKQFEGDEWDEVFTLTDDDYIRTPTGLEDIKDKTIRDISDIIAFTD